MENPKTKILNRIHEGILWGFFLINLAVIYFLGIDNRTTFVVTTSIWLLAHPLLYLIMDAVKLAHDVFYEPKRFGLVCMVFNLIVGVLIATVIFKIEKGYYTDYWYWWYVLSFLGLAIPMVICFILERKHKDDKPTPKIVRNR